MADDSKLRLGDDIRLYVDTAYTSGGAWGTATWVEVKCAEELSDDIGIIAAEFNCRGGVEVGSRRSRRRNRTITLGLYNQPGEAAFERILTAIKDATNTGPEILHLAVVDGDITVAGNDIYENDFIVVNAPRALPTDEGATFDLELKRAIDSPNDHTDGATA